MPTDKFIKDPVYRNSYVGKLVDKFYEANSRHSATQYAEAADAARARRDHLEAAFNSKKAAEYYDAAGDRERGDLERQEMDNDNYEQTEERNRNKGCCTIS